MLARILSVIALWFLIAPQALADDEFTRRYAEAKRQLHLLMAQNAENDRQGLSHLNRYIFSDDPAFGDYLRLGVDVSNTNVKNLFTTAYGSLESTDVTLNNANLSNTSKKVYIYVTGIFAKPAETDIATTDLQQITSDATVRTLLDLLNNQNDALNGSNLEDLVFQLHWAMSQEVIGEDPNTYFVYTASMGIKDGQTQYRFHALYEKSSLSCFSSDLLQGALPEVAELLTKMADDKDRITFIVPRTSKLRYVVLNYFGLADLYDENMPNLQPGQLAEIKKINAFIELIACINQIDKGATVEKDRELIVLKSLRDAYYDRLGRNLPGLGSDVLKLADPEIESVISIMSNCSPNGANDIWGQNFLNFNAATNLDSMRTYSSAANNRKFWHINTHGACGRPGILVCDEGERIRIPDDIANLNFSNQELIFLNACQSATGGSESSMIHSFLRKGGKRVIGSLWNVNDKGGKELVEMFYNKFCNNLDVTKINETLRQAQIDFKNIPDEDHSEPYFWANYQYVDQSITKDYIPKAGEAKIEFIQESNIDKIKLTLSDESTVIKLQFGNFGSTDLTLDKMFIYYNNQILNKKVGNSYNDRVGHLMDVLVEVLDAKNISTVYVVFEDSVLPKFKNFSIPTPIGSLIQPNGKPYLEKYLFYYIF